MILSIILSCIPFHSASAAPETTITIKTNPGARIQDQFFLYQEGKKFFCRTRQIPDHEIVVRNLKTIQPPFKNEVPTPGCKNTITWGKSTQCYGHGKDHLLDDLIRWCTNV